MSKRVFTGPPSPKTVAGALGAACASIFWVLATSLWWSGVFTVEAVATLTGSTGIVLGIVLAYLIPESGYESKPRAERRPRKPADVDVSEQGSPASPNNRRKSRQR